MNGFEDPRDQDPREPELPRWIFLHALRVTIGRTPVWLVAAGMLAALAAVQALPWLDYFDRTIGASYAGGAQLAQLDETFRFDHRAAHAAVDVATQGAGGVVALLALLVGVFCAGGWLQVFLERTQGESVRRFFYGGTRFFWRFFRVLLLTLLLLQLLRWLLYGRPWDWLVLETICGLEKPDLELFDSERTVRRLALVQTSLFACGFALLAAWGDYTRTRLAVHGTRSALWAGLCTAGALIRHPVRLLRPLVLLLGVEALVLGLAAWLTHELEGALGPDSTGWAILGLFSVGIGLHIARTIVRGARYSACVLATRDVVRPLSRPDPWKRSIGGPGGPRYPIDGDEYAVSL